VLDEHSRSLPPAARFCAIAARIFFLRTIPAQSNLTKARRGDTFTDTTLTPDYGDNAMSLGTILLIILVIILLGGFSGFGGGPFYGTGYYGGGGLGLIIVILLILVLLGRL
jgi:hypothetical protein